MERRLTIPETYWEDFSERQPVDEPGQMPVEVSRAGRRVTISANPEQMQFLLGDAKFYAEGNTDDTPAAVLRGARRVAQLCAELGVLLDERPAAVRSRPGGA